MQIITLPLGAQIHLDGHKILAPVASLNKPQQVLLRLRVRLVAIVKLDVSDGMLSAYSQGGNSTPDGNYASVATFPLAFTTLLKVVGTGSVSYGDTSYLSSPYSVQNIIEATSVTRAAFRTNHQGGYPGVDYIAFGF